MSAIFSDVAAPFPLVAEYVTQSEFDATVLTDWLTDDEQRRYVELQATAVAKRSRQWLLGRYAAKMACRRWLKEQGRPIATWCDIQIGNSESGMPFITIKGLGTEPAISIAHSGNEAIAAITAPGNPIGVDIENRPLHTDLHALAKRISSEAEFQRWFATITVDELSERFRTLWLAKEATAKCTGKGLQWRPGMFEVVALDRDTAEVSYGDKSYAVDITRTVGGMAAIARRML